MFKKTIFVVSLIVIIFSCTNCLMGTSQMTKVTTEQTPTREIQAVPAAISATVQPVATEEVKVLSVKTIAAAPIVAATAVKAAEPAPVKAAAKVEKKPVKGELKKSTVNEVLVKIRKTQAARKAMKLNIEIETKYTDANTSQIVKGTAFILKPDKFRVRYSEPADQTLISDGKLMWVYTPVLNQVIKQDLKKASFNTHFYIDIESSIDYFSKTSKTTIKEDEKTYMLTMTPLSKKNVYFDEMTVKVDKVTLQPDNIRMKYENTIVDTKFSDIISYTSEEAARLDDFSDASFVFKTPAGVEEIEASDMMQGNTIK